MEEQSIVKKFNAAFSRHAATRGDVVLIERRDGRLYMNDSEIGSGTLEIREDGVTYRSAALVDVRKPEQAEQDAYGYASRLAVAIWEKHYKDAAPQWKPLNDLMGVLTQIDNMTSGLTRPQQAEPVAWWYKDEPWFDGKRWHDNYSVTKEERVAKRTDPHARPLYFNPTKSNEV